MKKYLELALQLLVATVGTLLLLIGAFLASISAPRYEEILVSAIACELAAIACYAYNVYHLKDRATYWIVVLTLGMGMAGSVATHCASRLSTLFFD